MYFHIFLRLVISFIIILEVNQGENRIVVKISGSNKAMKSHKADIPNGNPKIKEMDTSDPTPIKNRSSGDHSINMGDFVEPKTRRVKRKKLSKEDFVLPDEFKPFQVAGYDPSRVAEYWNNMYLKQQLWTMMIMSFIRGLIQKCLPVTIDKFVYSM